MGDKIKGLFAVNGRSNRLVYWKIVIGAWLSFVIVAVLAMAVRSVVAAGAAGLVLVVVLALHICVTIRRLHDRDKSWPWVIVFVGIPALLKVLSDQQDLAGLGAAFTPLAIICNIWGFVELGCLKGTTGPNRFGPDRLAPDETVEAFT